MIITQRIEDDAHEVMNEGRGLCRVLAVGVLLAGGAVAIGRSDDKEDGKDDGKEIGGRA
jgi:hypothetical protein